MIRFPEFQSLLNLPLSIRKEISAKIQKSSKKFFETADEKSLNYTKKILFYLESNAKPMVELDENKLKKDLKAFIQRYEIMAKKPFESVYPKIFVDYLK